MHGVAHVTSHCFLHLVHPRSVSDTVPRTTLTSSQLPRTPSLTLSHSFDGMQPAMRIHKRLRSKTPDPRLAKQQPLSALPAPTPEDAKARRIAYLVTFSHTQAAQSQQGVNLVAPETLSGEALLARFRDACQHPVHVDPFHAAQGRTVDLKLVSVWRELHTAAADGQIHAHYHLAVLGSEKFSFMPVKRALLQRSGLASHWSTTHTGYWSCIRYCCLPSPSKPLCSLDPSPALWAADGMHPDPRTCCHEPATAAAHRARQLKAESNAAEAGKKEPRASEFDLWPIIVQNGFKNTPDNRSAHLQLMDYAKRHCSSPVCSFIFKIRAKLPSLIDDLWQWEGVAGHLQISTRSREDALNSAAAGECVCEGRWDELAKKVFTTNKLSTADLFKDVLQLLRDGRSENTPVLVFAGAAGGEGKSLLLKGLASIFETSEVFPCPEKGNFPLLGLEVSKIAILDDWRFDASVVPLATQLKWYDGSAFTIAKPQNVPGSSGHFVYKGSAPVFVSTKLQDIKKFRELSLPVGGEPVDGEASMLLRRLKVYSFMTPIVKPEKAAKTCARCFAKLLLSSVA